jgi:hypothetical protein
VCTLPPFPRKHAAPPPPHTHTQPPPACPLPESLQFTPALPVVVGVAHVQPAHSRHTTVDACKGGGGESNILMSMSPYHNTHEHHICADSFIPAAAAAATYTLLRGCMNCNTLRYKGTKGPPTQ